MPIFQFVGPAKTGLENEVLQGDRLKVVKPSGIGVVVSALHFFAEIATRRKTGTVLKVPKQEKLPGKVGGVPVVKVVRGQKPVDMVLGPGDLFTRKKR